MADGAAKRPLENGGGAAAGAQQAGGGSNKRQNVSWSWLWKSDTFSDVRITLRAPGPPAAAAVKDEAAANADNMAHERGTQTSAGAGAHMQPPGEASTTPELCVLAEVPAHRVVVASVSSYFRQRLLAWEQAQRGARTSEDGVSTAAPACAHLEEEISAADQLPAAEAVLQFMYTQELPADISTAQLISVARLAERWEAPGCTSACLSRLGNLTPGQLPPDLIAMVLADDLPRSLVDQPAFSPLLLGCQARLLQLYGRVQNVLTDRSRLASFCQLPLSAVRLWARLDELRVDSENSVALLLTHWWQANYGASDKRGASGGGTAVATASQQPLPAAATSDGNGSNNNGSGGGGAGGGGSKPDAPTARTTLSTLLRVNQLSASYLVSVLGHLPWWSPPADGWAMLMLCHALHPSKGTSLQQPIKDRLPAAWLAKARTKDDKQVAQHTWEVSGEELDALHKGAANGRILRESPGLYWRGYMWHVCLSLNSQREALWVGVRVRSPLPGLLPLPPLMEARFTLSVKEAGGAKAGAATGSGVRQETLNFGDGAALQPTNCNGTPRLLQVPASTAPRTSSRPPLSLFVNGKLHLGLTLETMQ